MLFRSDGTTNDPDDLAFMSEYNIQYCGTGGWGAYDSWAGAVKTCQDMGASLPSVADLEKLAEELYKDADGSFSGNRDNDKAFEMGFLPSASTSDFELWTRYESASTTGATHATFQSAHWSTSPCARGSINCGSASVCVLD